MCALDHQSATHLWIKLCNFRVVIMSENNNGFANICLEKIKIERYSLTGLTAVFGIITLIAFGVFVYHFFVSPPRTQEQKSKEQSKDVKLIRITSLIAFTLYSFGFVFILIGFIVCINRISAIGAFLNILAMLCVLIVFSIRLYFTIQ